MKKSDIAMIILIASVSVLVTYFVAKGIFGNNATQAVEVKTIDPISSTIVQPDPAVFNANAINPTVEVTIGGSSSSTPVIQSGQ